MSLYMYCVRRKPSNVSLEFSVSDSSFCELLGRGDLVDLDVGTLCDVLCGGSDVGTSCDVLCGGSDVGTSCDVLGG